MDYQKNTEHIGSSDIGILILSGFERGKGFQLKKLFFGGDGAYSAYIVDGQTQIPDHYELICEFNTWMRMLIIPAMLVSTKRLYSLIEKGYL